MWKMIVQIWKPADQDGYEVLKLNKKISTKFIRF